MSPQDDNLAKELGFNELPEEERAKRIQQFYETLRLKVLMALEDRLSEQQLEEFQQVNAKSDNAATTIWLEQAVPDYDEIANNEMTALKADIKQTSTRLRQAIEESDK